MTTVTGTFTLPSSDPEGAPIPDSGTVRFSLAASAVLQDAPPQIVTTGDVVVALDDEGAFSVDLLASDDPLWATEDDVPYTVTLTLSTTRTRYSVLVPTSAEPVDLSTLVVLDQPEVVAVPGPAPVITEGEFTAVPVAPGGVPTVDVTFTPGDPGHYTVDAEFGLVTGDTGATGDSAYEIAVAEGFTGTEAEWLESLHATDPAFTFSVSDVAPGGSATLDVTGTYPDLNLAFGVVEGEKGDTGSLDYWWRGAWTATTYGAGDVVTHNGSLWMTLTDTIATQVPGGAAVPVQAGAIGESGASLASTTLGWRWMPFTVSAETMLTHIGARDSGGTVCELRDASGSVLATYTPTGADVAAALSVPVLLSPGQTYYASTYSVYTGRDGRALSGVVASASPVLKGAWPGTLDNKYLGLTLFDSPSTPWAQLAQKGDKGDTGDTGPATTFTAGTATTLNAGEPVAFAISGTAPNLVLDLSVPQGVPGAVGAFQAKTANYTILGTDGTVAVDTTSGAVTLTLPSAAANSGKWLRIVKNGGANTLTVQRAGSDTISPSSGARTSVTFPAATHGEMMLVSSGTGWHVVSGQASDETVGRRLWKWEQALAASSTTASVGWQMIHADTGWRNIGADLLNGWAVGTSGLLALRRVGSIVTLSAYKLKWPAATVNDTNLPVQVPTGFRDDVAPGYGPPLGGAYRNQSATLYGQVMSMSLGRVAVYATSLPTADDGTVNMGWRVWWTTTDAWPSSLPGTAYGSIPT